MMNGFMIGNQYLLIKLTNLETMLVFNQHLNTKDGFASGIKMVPVMHQVSNTVIEIKKMIKTMSKQRRLQSQGI
jgi:hypothetical protein